VRKLRAGHYAGRRRPACPTVDLGCDSLLLETRCLDRVASGVADPPHRYLPSPESILIQERIPRSSRARRSTLHYSPPSDDSTSASITSAGVPEVNRTGMSAKPHSPCAQDQPAGHRVTPPPMGESNLLVSRAARSTSMSKGCRSVRHARAVRSYPTSFPADANNAFEVAGMRQPRGRRRNCANGTTRSFP